MECNICHKPIKGSCQAGAHVGCYTRANPPKPASNIADLVNWNGDPVLARAELMKMIQSNISSKIIEESIDRYNKRLMQDWQRRCDIYPEGE